MFVMKTITLAKKQVLAFHVAQHGAKRNILLFVRMVSDAERKTFLFANDAKGARRWIRIRLAEKRLGSNRNSFIEAVRKRKEKNTVVIPGGLFGGYLP